MSNFANAVHAARHAPGGVDSLAPYFRSTNENLIVPASAFAPISGSTATQGPVNNRYPAAWSLPAAVSNSLGCVVQVPQTWTAYNLAVLWCQTGTGTGNVKLNLDVDEIAGGGPPGAFVSLGTVTLAATTQFYPLASQFAPVAIPTAGSLQLLRVTRDGTDTLANAIAIIAAIIQNAS